MYWKRRRKRTEQLLPLEEYVLSDLISIPRLSLEQRNSPSSPKRSIANSEFPLVANNNAAGPFGGSVAFQIAGASTGNTTTAATTATAKTAKAGKREQAFEA